MKPWGDGKAKGAHVQEDGPTGPNLWRYDAPGREPGGMPTWPALDAQPQPPSRSNGGAPSVRLAAILAISLGANVALIFALVGMALFARAGYFAPGGIAGRSTPGNSATNTAMSSPTVALSPTPASGVLQVSPATVALGCDSGKRTQYFVLMNTGTEDVQWQANFSTSPDQAGIGLSNSDGTLRAGTSTAIQIQNRTHNPGQPGTIQFTTDSSSANQSASLAYNFSGCQ